MTVGLVWVSPTARPLAVVFLAGCVAMVVTVGWAVAVVPFAAFRRRERGDARTSSWLLTAAAAAVGTALGALLGGLLGPLLPARLSEPEAAGRALLAVFAASVVAVAMRWVTRWRARWRWWIVPGAFGIAIFLAYAWFVAALAQRNPLFDGAALVALTVAAVGWSSGVSPPRGRRALAVVGPAMVGCAAVTLGLVGTHPGARASLSASYPTASLVLAALRGLTDGDGDGFSDSFGGRDCDDDDPNVHPAQIEIVGNGIDDNCAGGELSAFTPMIQGPPTPAPGDHERRSIVLITVDTLRADALTRAPVAAPRLEELARRGARFERVYTQAPYTMDAVRSMLTGHYPMDYMVYGRFVGFEASLTQHLAGHGFATAIVSAMPQMSPYFLVGAETVEDGPAAAHIRLEGTSSAEVTDRALARATSLFAGERPFFLWVHYFDPHVTYVSRKGTPFAGDDDESRYWQEVYATDRDLGRLTDGLAELGYFDQRGIVAVTSDHGELFAADGRRGHAFWTDEATMRVPMVLVGEDIPLRVIPTRVGLLDLAPTLIELAAGVRLPMDGRSLVPVLTGDEADDRDVFARASYDTTFRPPDLIRVAWIGDWKLVHDAVNDTESLYDLRADPQARSNLVDDRPEVLSSMRDSMGRRWDASINSVAVARKLALLPMRGLDPELLAAHNERVKARNCVVTGKCGP
jgi:arylsulfatase A-like enzyme